MNFSETFGESAVHVRNSENYIREKSMEIEDLVKSFSTSIQQFQRVAVFNNSNDYVIAKNRRRYHRERTVQSFGSKIGIRVMNEVNQVMN